MYVECISAVNRHASWRHSQHHSTSDCGQHVVSCYTRHSARGMRQSSQFIIIIISSSSLLSGSGSWQVTLSDCYVTRVQSSKQSCELSVHAYHIMTLTHAPETVAINSTLDSVTSFTCQCTTSNIVDCLRGLKTVNDFGSRALARKTGVKFRPVALISGAGFWSVCPGPFFTMYATEDMKDDIRGSLYCWLPHLPGLQFRGSRQSNPVHFSTAGKGKRGFVHRLVVNTSLRHSCMAHVLKGSHSFTCTPCVHPLTEWTISAFAFPAEAGTHLLTPEGWKAELAWWQWTKQ